MRRPLGLLAGLPLYRTASARYGSYGMTVFQINVVASYSPTEPMTPAEGYPLLDAEPAVKPPDAIRAALWAWSEHVSDDPDRRLRITDVAIEEAGIPLPARLTMTVTCENRCAHRVGRENRCGIAVSRRARDLNKRADSKPLSRETLVYDADRCVPTTHRSEHATSPQCSQQV